MGAHIVMAIIGSRVLALAVAQLRWIKDVKSRYSGLRIEGDTITLNFVKKMMDDFKKQEKWLYRRYASKILLQIIEKLKALSSLVDITVPHGKHITICGDVHGQVKKIMKTLSCHKIHKNDGKKDKEELVKGGDDEEKCILPNEIKSTQDSSDDSAAAQGFLKRCATSFRLNQLSEFQRSVMATFLFVVMIGLSVSLGHLLKDSTSITLSMGSAIEKLLPLIIWMTAYIATFVTWAIIVWSLPVRRYIFPMFVLYFIMCSSTWLVKVAAIQIMCGFGSVNGALFASTAAIFLFLTSGMFYLWLHIDD